MQRFSIPLNNNSSQVHLTVLPISLDELKALIEEVLDRRHVPPPIDHGLPEFLSMKQATAKYSCKPSLLHRLSSNRSVTTRKVGRNLHFDAADLERHFNSKLKKSSSAISKAITEQGVFPTLRKGRK